MLQAHKYRFEKIRGKKKEVRTNEMNKKEEEEVGKEREEWTKEDTRRTKKMDSNAKMANIINGCYVTETFFVCA